ncbi:STAS domain-containing protein [Streptomyces sp. 8L]|uniref:STAS domain-containing protein n=1 Tax=Streptomyces sp. 8L TaxID=2877242 RepID=UPI001CD798DD|nr:STAS domain-containing protein [Streptomyces sp. 8L]MCA1218352.1 STAS domain-containing protein [Streptomyces sp. 8L]
MTTLPYPVFTVTAERTPRAVLLRLSGELDHETAGELLDAVRAHLPGSGPEGLRLDCGGLADCDSTGLSALLMARRLTVAADVPLHLDNRQPPLQRLLEITGTLEYLTAPPARSGQETGTDSRGAQDSEGAHGSRPGAS